MTQVADRIPLTNPVPGFWMQRSDQSIPPVYVPHEPIYERDERTKKDKIVGYAPGVHYKRLVGEEWMQVNPPAAAVAPVQPQGPSTEELLQDALRQIAELKAAMGVQRVSELVQEKPAEERKPVGRKATG